MNLGHFPFFQVCLVGVCLFYLWISQHSEEIVYPIILYKYRERTKYSPNSCSVMFNSLWPHRLQHARPSCPSPTPWIYSNSCPSSRWCQPTISSVAPFSCLQSFPASGSFLMSQLFISGSQTIGASAAASVLPMNIQSWFSLGLTGLISLKSKGLLRVFSSMRLKWPSRSINGHRHRGRTVMWRQT